MLSIQPNLLNNKNDSYTKKNNNNKLRTISDLEIS